MKTNVYVDGFNLYYGCLRNSPYRWLDVRKLVKVMLPRAEIVRIRYFTALVKPTPDDPNKLQRQLTLLRALQTIPNLTVHYGHFLRHQRVETLVTPLVDGTTKVLVWEREEKGSDVSLATYLLLDAVEKEYEVAVIISNDSDLLEPIRVVKEYFGLKVGILNPHRKNPSYALLKEASFYRTIKKRALRRALFPDVLEDKKGRIVKPASW